MSVKRSPPKTSSGTSQRRDQKTPQDSETVSEMKDSDSAPGHHMITRHKRKHGEVDNSELKELLCDMQRKQQAEFSSLKQDMDTIKQQNLDYQKSLEYLSDMYDSLLRRMDTVEKENLAYKTRIANLEGKVEQLERNLKASSIEIRNVPVCQTENKSSLRAHLLQLSDVINLNIQDKDIRDVFRIRKKNNSGPIIAEFTTNSLKEMFIKSSIDYNKERPKEQKLNTSHLKIEGKPMPIYITDNLTTKTRRLHFLSREFVKTHQYAGYWIAYGKVYLREKEGKPALRIDCEEDLAKLNLKK
ncbi:uncharacterized protein LOC114353800 [Ostrinia furnacalis]|uniref:uncharacterized protein LOC114353800 n=1 Tax=Ostrinia furnacalis TaxID=93504 RepID=UPI00103A4626|nr:uncharacterized protein LOC114353800 [Ostrinia furnacalis]